MSNLVGKFKKWEAQLDSSTEEATKQKCVAEIFETMATVRDERNRSAIVWKVLHKVCTETRRAKSFAAYSDLYVKFVPYIRDWEKFIGYLNYYMQWLVVEEHFKDALVLVPVINQIQLTTKKAATDYFTINTRYYAGLIMMDALPDDSFENCANNVLKSLQTARTLKPECFLQLLNEMFAKKQYFRFLLLKDVEGKEKFLQSVTALLASLKTVNDIERFTVDTSTHLIFLLGIAVVNNTVPNLVLPYLKACMGLATAANKNKPSQQMVTAIYFLIKLFAAIDSDQFNSNLDHVLDKFEKLLELDETTAPWILNSSVTICEVLNFLTEKARSKLNSENIKKIAELLMKLTKILTKSDILAGAYEKIVCTDCHHIGRHEFFNLAFVATKVFHRAIELKLSDKQIAHTFLTAFNYVAGPCLELKCKHFETIFHNFCVICCKALMDIKCEYYANYALNILEILKNMKIKPDMLTDVRLILIYEGIFSVLKRHKEKLQMSCLYVVHAMNKESSEKITNVADIVNCYKQFKEAGYTSNHSISDILDTAVMKLEVPTYDRNKLIRCEVEASRYLTDCTFKESLLRKAMCHARNEIEFAEIVIAVGKNTDPSLEAKIKSAIANLTNQIATTKKDMEKNLLALAQLKFRYSFFKLDQAKTSFAGKDITETTLKDVNCNDYKSVNVLAENRIVASLIEARKCYERFYSCVVKKSPENFNLEQIVDHLSQIARQLNLRGYINHAYESWLLVYEITRSSDMKLHRIRSVSYFAEYSHIIEELNDCIDLKETIRDISSDLLSCLHELDSFTPRQQNYVMLGLINIAFFYSRQKDYRRAILLIELAKKKRRTMSARNNTAELISINLMAFDFHMITKCPETNVIISPYAYIHAISDEIRNIKNITSEDSVNVPAFLFRLVTDASHFVINRLCATTPMKPHLNSLLKFSTEIGMGLRMAQIISLMAMIDLQNESIENCQTKLVVLDTILTNEPEPTIKKEASVSPSLCKQLAITEPFHIAVIYDQFVEPTRKLAPKSPRSPRHFKLPNETSNINTTQYFLTHSDKCSCAFCLIPMFRMIAFEVGCLHGRRYYITGDYKTSQIFFAAAFNWWYAELKMSVYNHLFNDSIACMIVFYLNTLRRLNNYKRALEIIEIANEYYRENPKLIDITFEQNLAEQKFCISQFLEQPTKQERKTDAATSSSSSDVAAESTSTPRYKPVAVVSTRSKKSTNDSALTITSDSSTENTISTRSRRKK